MVHALPTPLWIHLMNKSLSECLLGRVKNKVKNAGLNVRSKKKDRSSIIRPVYMFGT
jgi:hypothetical protein